jgi:hypothetical protein
MKKELKAAIIAYILDNLSNFQLDNDVTGKFRAYIYDHEGEYLIGGEDVRCFIKSAIKLLTD